jgi:hypothetical protein
MKLICKQIYVNDHAPVKLGTSFIFFMILIFVAICESVYAELIYSGRKNDIQIEISLVSLVTKSDTFHEVVGYSLL